MSKVYIVGVSHGWQCPFQPQPTDEQRERIMREFENLSLEQIEQQLREEIQRHEHPVVIRGKPSINDPKTGILREITSEEFAAFDAFLRNAVHRCNIKEFLEEASGPPHQRIAGLAAELGLAHNYCDLAKEERAKRGIRTNEQRERFWLTVLKDTVKQFPLLMVCGADHVDTFGQLLRDAACEPIADATTGAIAASPTDSHPTVRTDTEAAATQTKKLLPRISRHRLNAPGPSTVPVNHLRLGPSSQRPLYLHPCPSAFIRG